LARAASISPSAVTLARGGAGRIKSFHLKGDPAALAGALLAAIGGGRR
jgi:hypothetical protein